MIVWFNDPHTGVSSLKQFRMEFIVAQIIAIMETEMKMEIQERIVKAMMEMETVRIMMLIMREETVAHLVKDLQSGSTLEQVLMNIHYGKSSRISVKRKRS